MSLKNLPAILFLCVFLKPVFSVELNTQNHFKPGSYQHILDNNKGQPFVLVVWSINCPSCLKDMEILKQIHLGMPRFKFVMLSTDHLSDEGEVEKIIEQQDLTSMESWIFADDNAQKLRFEIDPAWYGEIPRTYFFNSKHEREGFSGALTHKQFITMISEILKPEHK